MYYDFRVAVVAVVAVIFRGVRSRYALSETSFLSQRKVVSLAERGCFSVSRSLLPSNRELVTF